MGRESKLTAMFFCNKPLLNYPCADGNSVFYHDLDAIMDERGVKVDHTTLNN